MTGNVISDDTGSGPDSDVDNDSLTTALQTDVSHGALTLNADGSFVYTPTLNFNGSDGFSYILSNGVLTDTAQVTLTVTASAAQYALNVTLSGNGSGTVNSSLVGIDCGSNCTVPFNDNTVVALTATADSGSSFTGWSGGGCSGTGTCVVTMTGAVGVTAVFDKNDYFIYLPMVIKP